MQKEQPDIKTLSLSEFKNDIRWKAHLNLCKLRPIKNLIFKAALALARSLLKITFLLLLSSLLLYCCLLCQNRRLCWEATVMGGLEMGPSFSFKTWHCNLKKRALFFISFGNSFLLCYCYIFVMKIKNGMSLS